MNDKLPAKKLTAKQKMFIEEYLVDSNATQAATRAGYSKKTAYSIADEILRKPEVSEAIEKRRAEIVAELRADQLETVRQALRCRDFDPRNLYDENGNLKPITELDYDTAAAIRGIEVVKKKNPQFSKATQFDEPEFLEVVKVTFVDRLKAVELMGNMQNLFDKSFNVNVNTNVVVLPAKVPIGTPIQKDDNCGE